MDIVVNSGELVTLSHLGRRWHGSQFLGHMTYREHKRGYCTAGLVWQQEATSRAYHRLLRLARSAKVWHDLYSSILRTWVRHSGDKRVRYSQESAIFPKGDRPNCKFFSHAYFDRYNRYHDSSPTVVLFFSSSSSSTAATAPMFEEICLTCGRQLKDDEYDINCVSHSCMELLVAAGHIAATNVRCWTLLHRPFPRLLQRAAPFLRLILTIPSAATYLHLHHPYWALH